MDEEREPTPNRKERNHCEEDYGGNENESSERTTNALRKPVAELKDRLAKKSASIATSANTVPNPNARGNEWRNISSKPAECWGCGD